MNKLPALRPRRVERYVIPIRKAYLFRVVAGDVGGCVLGSHRKGSADEVCVHFKVSIHPDQQEKLHDRLEMAELEYTYRE